jgi:hypothetical protein
MKSLILLVFNFFAFFLSLSNAQSVTSENSPHQSIMDTLENANAGNLSDFKDQVINITLGVINRFFSSDFNYTGINGRNSTNFIGSEILNNISDSFENSTMDTVPDDYLSRGNSINAMSVLSVLTIVMICYF